MTKSKRLQTKEISEKKIGEIVAEDYRTATVFEKYGIDFCCGGQVLLSAACQEKDLDIDAIQQEIKAAKSEPIEHSRNYTTWSLSFLADYIVNTHHAYLNQEMGPIASYAHKDDLYREHEEIGDAVHGIRRLANDYAIPEDACNTFTLTYKKLKAFEDDLHRHVHLENNILFLKAGQL